MKNTKYQHLFFDLDRTLWDFDRNAGEALMELFDSFEMKPKLGVEVEDFLKVYWKINNALWQNYRKGKINKEELRSRRFYETFLKFGYKDEDLGIAFNEKYVITASSKTNVLDGTFEILEYLKKKYQLHIITNGFVETQNRKLDNCNLRSYFEEIIISDGLHYKKPDKRIFHHAMKAAKARSNNSLMIGDDYLTDIIGAKGVGVDQVYLSDGKAFKNQATFIIYKLQELIGIL